MIWDTPGWGSPGDCLQHCFDLLLPPEQSSFRARILTFHLDLEWHILQDRLFMTKSCEYSTVRFDGLTNTILRESALWRSVNAGGGDVYLRVVLVHSEGRRGLPDWAQTRIEQLAHLAMVRDQLDLRNGDS
jgi:hypothetical protein